MTAMCIAAANYIIQKTNKYNEDRDFKDCILLTGKRLQKMLFFCDVKYMLQNNSESMFRDEFYAWPSGPVIPSVYYSYMQFQNGTMQPIEEGKHSPLTSKMIDVIDKVFDETCKIDTFDLVERSHVAGGPWERAYKEDDPKHDEIIEKQSIYEFYSSLGRDPWS